MRDRGQNGKFRSFYDFCKRLYDAMNRRVLESLIKCGSLDHLGANRREMLSNSEPILDFLGEEKRRNVEGQIGFFDGPQEAGSAEFKLVPGPDLSPADKLAMEKEVTGLYLSGHPMAAYAGVADSVGACRIGDLLENAGEEGGRWHDGDVVTVLAILTKVRLKVTKSNSTMAFVILEDMFGSIEMLVFPKTLVDYAEQIAEGRILTVRARLSLREDKEPELICEQVSPAPSADGSAPAARSAPESSTRRSGEPKTEKKKSAPGLYLKTSGPEDPGYLKAKKYCAVFDGPTQLYVYFTETRKLFHAPLSMRVSVNDVLLRELKKLLGEENVAFVDGLQQ